MTRPTSHLYGRAFLARLAAVLIIVAFAAPSHGAISAPRLQNGDAEAKFKLDCWTAENSVLQRNKVAQQRYQKKLDRRATIIAGLKAELAMRKNIVTIASEPVREQPHVAQIDGSATTTLVWMMLALAAVLPMRYFWRRAGTGSLRPASASAAWASNPIHDLRPKVIHAPALIKPAAQAKPAAAVRPPQRTPDHAAGGGASGQPRRQRQRPQVWALS
jgi:hypothetical protein